MIKFFVNDIICNSKSNICKISPNSVQDIRNAGFQIVDFSTNVGETIHELKEFLYKNVYRCNSVEFARQSSYDKVLKIYDKLKSSPDKMPILWYEEYKNKQCRDRVIIDYIAGMTDKYADSWCEDK